MNEEFDRYKNTYEHEIKHSIGFIRQDHDFFIRSKADHLVDLVGRHVGTPAALSVLDVGCGVGTIDSMLQTEFASIHGVDVAHGVIERASAENPGVEYGVYDGENLPFRDASFDVSFAICVLHHVVPAARSRVVAEMRRVTRPGGAIMIFEHNPFNPLTRLAVARCAFDEDVVLLRRRDVRALLQVNDVKVVEERYILVSPWGPRLSRWLDRRLKRVPLGAQYVSVGRGEIS
jgi:ubiquinone/menaquinone biosynthesis C-methylase UbiE